MFRLVLIALLGLYLIAVGVAPAAAAPVTLAGAGLAVIIGAIPGPVLALAAVAVWLHYRHQPASQPRRA
ncbi:hypothetical protein AAW14_06315 [Streptomyces hygroscopicus]|uniref:hypothetical protein n=1 Tax=Streptomyces hygroscopicus TaxID=1912 RepID=UPI00223E91A8|nr:hypothetical protein [Streptomyces hygroscopicus]MCW7941655.1 hypothetical protein [Streptomyces hygroscopicus]